MNKDIHNLFESYKAIYNEDMPYPEFAKLSKHANSKLPEDKPKEKLKYDYEIVAYLPRDIDISTREGQDKVLSLAYKELVKRVTNKYKNPERAASNMFYDEDFPMELVSQYSHYQKHGFPDIEEDDYREQMPDSREEYSAQDYAQEMELKGEQEEDDSTALIVRGTVHSLGNGYSILVTKEREEDRYSFDIDVLKDIDPKNSKYEYVTKIHRLGEIGNSIKNWAGSKDPLLVQKTIDVLNKHGAKIPNIKHEDEERRLDPKCWKGYHKQGTKLKGGKRVNNCVKNS